jgi:hypothetical protein
MISLVCAVVFSVGIVRDVPHARVAEPTMRDRQWHRAPYVIFPCLMTDMEAYQFYSKHDPQINGDYDPIRGCPCGEAQR